MLPIDFITLYNYYFISLFLLSSQHFSFFIILMLPLFLLHSQFLFSFRIQKYFGCSNECFVLSLVYIDRIVKIHEEFTVSILNIHRYVRHNLLCSLHLTSDVPFTVQNSEDNCHKCKQSMIARDNFSSIVALISKFKLVLVLLFLLVLTHLLILSNVIFAYTWNYCFCLYSLTYSCYYCFYSFSDWSSLL